MDKSSPMYSKIITQPLRPARITTWPQLSPPSVPSIILLGGSAAGSLSARMVSTGSRTRCLEITPSLPESTDLSAIPAGHLCLYSTWGALSLRTDGTERSRQQRPRRSTGGCPLPPIPRTPHRHTHFLPSV